MNTLCNETLRLVVKAVTSDSIPTLHGCSKEFKSLTSDRYISVQSATIRKLHERRCILSKMVDDIERKCQSKITVLQNVFTLASRNLDCWQHTADTNTDHSMSHCYNIGQQRAHYMYDYIEATCGTPDKRRTLDLDDYPDVIDWNHFVMVRDDYVRSLV